MVAVEYDQSLVEQAAFLAARRDGHLENQLHKAIDPLYAIADEQLRQDAFARTFQEFFTKLGLDRVVSDLIAERPLIKKHLARCIVREAPQTKDESAELFLGDNSAEAHFECTLVIQACPQSLVDAGKFAMRMQRDLLHVSDMLDERFAYQREAIAGLPARQNLVRDRYRVLWDIYVEGRLEREGRSSKELAESLRTVFERVFSKDRASLGVEAFNRVFDASTLTHRILLDWAHNPAELLGDRDDSTPSMYGFPGERCPLCGFPTHDWYGFGTGTDRMVLAGIKRDHADWSPEQGACRQCAEMHAAREDPLPAHFDG